MKKGYRGIVNSCGAGSVSVLWQDEAGLHNKPLEHRMRHSPDGFSWGYGGSGPSDLARSILWDHLEKEPGSAMYQAFKWDVIAKLDMEANFVLTAEQVASWVAEWMRETTL